MQITRLAIPDVILIQPKVFGDARGFFFESFNQRAFNAATGTDYQFVQDNHSRSSKGVSHPADSKDAHQYEPLGVCCRHVTQACDQRVDQPT